MRFLKNIEEWVCAVCLVVMTVLTFANVLSRYALHMSLSFSDELTTNLFILLSMMGTAIAAKRCEHLGLTILTDAVGPKARKALNLFGYLIATVFSLALFYYGIHMVISQYNLGQVTPTMQWPEWIFGTFVPIGAFFMTVRFGQVMKRIWNEDPQKKEGENG